MTNPPAPTLKQMQRRALKAEAELESIQRIRKFEHGLELTHHRELAVYKVALKEAMEALQWALEQTT
jgi:hypothetical protein